MPVLLFTSKNISSRNIAEEMINLGYESIEKNVWQRDNVKLIDTETESILDVPTDFVTDCVIVLSSHKSKQEQKALTAHFPGNWNNADFGGAPRTLNIAYASKLKIIMQNIYEENKQLNWDVTLEADHHGPTCNVPIIFVEYGGSDKYLTDKNAAKVVAHAVEKSIKNNKTFETVFAVGCGHYPRDFKKMELEDDIAIGHILPKYHLDSLAEDTFKQAIEKNIEKIKQVWILKENLNKKQKTLIKDLCDSFHVEYVER